MESEERIAGAKIGAEMVEKVIDAEIKGAEITSKEVAEGAKIGEKFAEALLKGEQEKEKEREISDRVRRDRED